MTKQFDLWRVLKQISNVHLRQFFAARKELQDVPWDGLKETKIAPVVEALQKMPAAKRRQIQILLSSFARLSDNAGQKVLLEEVAWPVSKKGQALCGAKASDRQGDVGIPARQGRLRRGRRLRPRRWLVGDKVLESLEQLARQKRSGDAAAPIDALKAGLCAITSARNSVAKTAKSITTRGGTARDICSPICPTGRTTSWSSTTTVSCSRSICRRPSELVRVHSRDWGAFEMIAAGGKPTQLELRRIFCEAILGRQVEDEEPDRPAYLLDHLIKPGFKFTWPTNKPSTVFV